MKYRIYLKSKKDKLLVTGYSAIPENTPIVENIYITDIEGNNVPKDFLTNPTNYEFYKGKLLKIS